MTHILDETPDGVRWAAAAHGVCSTVVAYVGRPALEGVYNGGWYCFEWASAAGTEKKVSAPGLEPGIRAGIRAVNGGKRRVEVIVRDGEMLWRLRAWKMKEAK